MAVDTLKVLGASNHSEGDREENNFYSTDPIAVDTLFARERLNFVKKDILEPCCGNLNLSNRIKELLGEDFGSITNSDLIERGYEDIVGDYREMDFKNQYDIIITNPPYDRKGTHVEITLKAIDDVKDGGKVYMFLKTLFLESQNRYDKLFSKYPPARIYVYSGRINCYKNDNRSLKDSAVSYSWFVWEKGFTGKTTLEWIR